jgi:transposase-like protein
MVTSPMAARTRRVFTAAKRAGHLARFQRSGLSQSEFCRRAGIHQSTFSQWRRAARAPAGQARSSFAEVQLSVTKAEQASAVILRLANGATLEVHAGTEAMWQGLGLLLKALQS